MPVRGFELRKAKKRNKKEKCNVYYLKSEQDNILKLPEHIQGKKIIKVKPQTKKNNRLNDETNETHKDWVGPIQNMSAHHKGLETGKNSVIFLK